MERLVDDEVTMAPYSIRHANLDDLEMIVPLFDAYRQFYRKPADRDLARAFLRARMEAGQSTILLALDQDTVVGFTQLYPSFSSGAAASILILNDLFVVPSARRCGVATSLLRAAAEVARAAGAVRLTLSTEIVNEVARQLYEREGWTQQTDFCVYNLALT